MPTPRSARLKNARFIAQRTYLCLGNSQSVRISACGGDTIRTGRHMRFEKETPLNNLFLAMLDRLEASVDELGDSTGRVKGLV